MNVDQFNIARRAAAPIGSSNSEPASVEEE
jgi:hypothetical protein